MWISEWVGMWKKLVMPVTLVYSPVAYYIDPWHSDYQMEGKVLTKLNQPKEIFKSCLVCFLPPLILVAYRIVVLSLVPYHTSNQTVRTHQCHCVNASIRRTTKTDKHRTRPKILTIKIPVKLNWSFKKIKCASAITR